MTRALRAELVKLRSTRAWWVVLLLGLGYCLAVTGVALGTGRGAAYGGAERAYAGTLVLGVLGGAGEYRHRTIAATLLAVPRRGRAVAAGLAAYLIAGLGYAVVIVGATAAVVLAVRGLSATAPALLLGAVLTATLYAPIGLAVGALVRDQAAAVAGALVYIGWTAPYAGRWPGPAVLLGCAVVLAAVGARVTLRRDVT